MNESTAFEIRPLRETGIAQLIALAGEIWRAHYPGIISVPQIEYMLAQRYNETVIREELARDDLWWSVLSVENKMAGFASYFTTGEPGEMKLDKLYVHPGMQRRGYGGALIGHVLSAMRERGLRGLTLAVNKHNHNAITAYRKHGFRIVRTAITDIGNGFIMDDYIMMREIGAEYVS